MRTRAGPRRLAAIAAAPYHGQLGLTRTSARRSARLGAPAVALAAKKCQRAHALKSIFRPSAGGPAPLDSRSPLEKRVVAIAAAVFFFNVVDFLMVAPLGPDFAAGLRFEASNVGLVGGAYTGAAAVSGLAGAFFLDRFDRRKALAVALTGLVVGTLLGGFAVDLHSLVLARVVAGSFGGPASSLVFSMVADVVPAERRGRAMGTVMGSFAVASVVGLPVGLKLAEIGSWKAPFFAVGGLGGVILALALALLPPMRMHLDRRVGATERAPSLAAIVLRPLPLLALAASATIMTGGFLILPNFAAFVQHNLGYPRSRLDLLYLLGGCASYVTMRITGRAVDRFGSPPVAVFGVCVFAVSVGALFLARIPASAVLPVYIMLATSGALRHVPYATLLSKVPSPETRARFASVQSAVEHLASAIAAIGSSRMLSVDRSGALVGMSDVAAVSIAFTFALVPLLWVLETRVKARSASTPADLEPGVGARSAGDARSAADA